MADDSWVLSAVDRNVQLIEESEKLIEVEKYGDDASRVVRVEDSC